MKNERTTINVLSWQALALRRLCRDLDWMGLENVRFERRRRGRMTVKEVAEIVIDLGIIELRAAHGLDPDPFVDPPLADRADAGV